VYERAAQHSRSICCDCEKEKKGHNHETFTMKVVKSVFILLVTRGYDVLYSDWEEKILRRSVHHVELTFMYCAQKHTLLSYRKLSFQLLLINFPEFNFRCSLAL